MKSLVLVLLIGLISLFSCTDKSDIETSQGYEIEEKFISKKPFTKILTKHISSIKDFEITHPGVNFDSIKHTYPPDKLEIKIDKFDFEISIIPKITTFTYDPSLARDTQFKPRTSMREELLSLIDFDYGKYKAMVFQNPGNKQDIKGFIHIPMIWAEQIKLSNNIHDINMSIYDQQYTNIQVAVINLVEAVNKYTDIQAKMDNHLFLSSSKLSKTPFVYITTNKAFELTQTEKENFGNYLENGGFAILDNPEPWYECSAAEASLRQMLKDILGKDARFQPIPNDHDLYHCYFDFDGGPPQGSENLSFDRSGMVITTTTGVCGERARNAAMSKPVHYLEGIYIGDRLAAIYSDKGYTSKWQQRVLIPEEIIPPSHLSEEDKKKHIETVVSWYPNNLPQLKMGVNMIVYALTQPKGITQDLMEKFSSIQ